MADSFSVSAGGSGAVNLLEDFETALGSQVIGATVGRVKMTVAWDTTTTSAALDSLVLGIIVAPSTMDPGVDLIPLTEPHLDWMYWSKRFPFEEAKGVSGSFMWELDVKAMRKLEELGETLWLAVQLGPIMAGTVAFGSSVLILMP